MSSELVADDLLSAFSPNSQASRNASGNEPAASYSGPRKQLIPPSKRPRISKDGTRDAFGFEVDDLDNIEAEFENIRRLSSATDQWTASRSSGRALNPDLKPQPPRSRTLSPASRSGRRQHRFVNQPLEFPQGQRWVESTSSAKRSASEVRSVSSELSAPEPDGGEELSLEKHRERIAALIARKRKDNEASRFRHKLARKQLAYLGVADPSEQTIAEAHQNLKRRMEASARGTLETQDSASPQPTHDTPDNAAESELQDSRMDEDDQDTDNNHVALEQAAPHQLNHVTTVENVHPNPDIESTAHEVLDVVEPSGPQPTSPELESNQHQLERYSQQSQPLRPLLSARLHHQAVTTEVIMTRSHIPTSTIRAELVQPPSYAFDVRTAEQQVESHALLWTPDQHLAFTQASDYNTLNADGAQWARWTAERSSFSRTPQAPILASHEPERSIQSSTSASPAALAAMSIFGPSFSTAPEATRTVPSSFFGTTHPSNGNVMNLPRPPIVPSNMNMFSGQARESVFLGRNGLATPGEDEEHHNMFRN